MNRKFTEQELIRREKLKKYENMGIEPYSSKVDFSHNSQTLKTSFDKFSKEELHDKEMLSSAVGRIISMRGPFIVVKDSNGQSQVYIAKKEFPEINDLVSTLDLGDIIWFEGIVMKTNTGTITIRANKLQLLSKSLRPLPEKFHGLQDVEQRYRRRYLDLISNDEIKEVFWKRTKIIGTIRRFFDGLDYMEVDTPVLQPILGGAAAKPFTTFHNALDKEFYLRIATELPLKRLLVGGIDRVYEIGRLFRNEGIDATHNPEFTTIEFYEAHSDLEGMMNRTEQLFASIADKLEIEEVDYDGKKIQVKKKFARINMVDAIKKETGIDFNKEMTLEEASKYAKEHNIKIEKYAKIGHIINEFFEKYIEEKIIQPTFIYGHPIEISPLAATNKVDPRFTDRAELFINGKEYANMFTELNDPIDQMQRFENQLLEKESGNDEATEIDLDFVEALEHGMPPAGGCGIGVDRLVMLFTGKTSIREILLFPHMKDENNLKSKK